MGKKQNDCHSKLLGLTNNKVKRKYGIVFIGSWTFVNNSSLPIESNRFSKWQAHDNHRKVWVPPLTRPPILAFIDTLSSCLRDGTQESFLGSSFFQNQMQVCCCLFCFFLFFLFFVVFFFFLFFFFVFLLLFFLKTKFTVSGAYIWHSWCKTLSDWHAWSFFLLRL